MRSARLLPLLVTSLVAAAAPALLAADEKVPLKLELPKPLFVGTPRPIQLSNLEPATAAKKGDLLVPAGTKLLSRGKTVTSSDPLPVIGELTFVTDGEKSGTEGSFVELGPGTQWVQIDLGAPAKIAAVALWHFHSQARVYHDVIVQVSDDAEFKKGVQTVYNSDDDNSSGLGKGSDFAYIETNKGRVIDAKGAKGQYVRLYSAGNTSDELNHYVEVEVFGEEAK